MKKFRFQFETLEKVRKARESEALRVLSEAQALHARAISHKQELIDGLQMGLRRREALATNGSTTVQAFVIETDFIQGQKQRIVQADQAILRAKRQVEKALRNYLFARRQTRMIEMLREKAWAEYKIARRKQEQKESDDMTIMRRRLTG